MTTCSRKTAHWPSTDSNQHFAAKPVSLRRSTITQQNNNTSNVKKEKTLKRLALAATIALLALMVTCIPTHANQPPTGAVAVTSTSSVSVSLTTAPTGAVVNNSVVNASNGSLVSSTVAVSYAASNATLQASCSVVCVTYNYLFPMLYPAKCGSQHLDFLVGTYTQFTLKTPKGTETIFTFTGSGTPQHNDVGASGMARGVSLQSASSYTTVSYTQTLWIGPGRGATITYNPLTGRYDQSCIPAT